MRRRPNERNHFALAVRPGQSSVRKGDAGRPSIWGLCCGHGRRNMLLPMNAKVSLDATERTIKVLENVLD
jgi:muramoyltetrapeptide carboxypeptidase LdcA involved in peptidoglycan recycling